MLMDECMFPVFFKEKLVSIKHQDPAQPAPEPEDDGLDLFDSIVQEADALDLSLAAPQDCKP